MSVKIVDFNLHLEICDNKIIVAELTQTQEQSDEPSNTSKPGILNNLHKPLVVPNLSDKDSLDINDVNIELNLSQENKLEPQLKYKRRSNRKHGDFYIDWKEFNRKKKEEEELIKQVAAAKQKIIDDDAKFKYNFKQVLKQLKRDTEKVKHNRLPKGPKPKPKVVSPPKKRGPAYKYERDENGNLTEEAKKLKNERNLAHLRERYKNDPEYKASHKLRCNIRNLKFKKEVEELQKKIAELEFIEGIEN